MSTPDRIEKSVVVAAPIARVWRAVSEAEEFGAWFGVAFDGPFVEGGRVTGKIVPTRADPEIAAKQAPHAGHPFEITIERIEPPHRLSFRWHPFAVDAAIDVSAEPTTLVVFALEEVAGGTRVTITESGFDRVPLARRAAAFTANEGGWQAQTRLLSQHLAHAS